MSNTDFPKFIRVKGAKEHNLKNIDIDIPLNRFTTVTGVSGSGKSSLVFDTLFQESRGRFIKATAGFSSRAAGKIVKADVESIEGLPASISVSQFQKVNNSRSTVGTLSEIYDMLRLLYARFGKSAAVNEDLKVNRSLFSFNSPEGACPVCKGLGVVEKLSEDLLIEDPSRSLSEGCFKITNSSGYIMYSQVTPDVLRDICSAEGFSTDTPWNELTEENRKVIFYGSNKLKVPFGKHTLESRMKWTGITAKPREEGYYKGIIPVMEEILKRDRNPNILKYTVSLECNGCRGSRLSIDALSFLYHGLTIGELSEKSITEAKEFFSAVECSSESEREVVGKIVSISEMIENLGMGYLTLNRNSSTLGGGEVRVLRLVNQVISGIRGVLYLFDEPTTGLHSVNITELNRVIRRLVNAGNTVVAVTHDEDTILSSDYVVEIGPGAGKEGGTVIFAGDLSDFLSEDSKSITASCIKRAAVVNRRRKSLSDTIAVESCSGNNLENIDVAIYRGCINTVTGVPGAGKTSLLRILEEKVNSNEIAEFSGRAVFIDKSPIGKSPRSNPATYTGLFTLIRDIFAALPESKEKGFKKGLFSFNVKGGRCEACEGAGVISIGMHFLGNIELECEECKGRRFKEDILKIRYKGRNIYEVLELSFSDALDFFRGETAVVQHIESLVELGLGYIKLGQPSTTLSGGEAQRVKLASEMVKNGKNGALYLFDEPCQGLHFKDIEVLLKAFDHLLSDGNTIVAAEYDHSFIRSSDWLIDMGPGSGIRGGKAVFTGSPGELIDSGDTATAYGLRRTVAPSYPIHKRSAGSSDYKPVSLKGVNTNNLKNISVDIPVNVTTAVTGVSGSGKSSLVFDTLFAEGYNRYLESYSPYMRSVLGEAKKPDVESSDGIMPAVGIGVKSSISNPRVTVGTISGIYDLLRLLFSRRGKIDGRYAGMSAGEFSFNNEHGSCLHCRGLGFLEKCSPYKLITDDNRSLLNGAMNGSAAGRFYGDIHGQYTALLKAVGKVHGIDYAQPWNQLSEEAAEIAMYGTGDEIYSAVWSFKRKQREGEHNFTGIWKGFCAYVEEEYDRKRGRKSADALKTLMVNEQCPQCYGAGLKSESLKAEVNGRNIRDFCNMELKEISRYFSENYGDEVIDTIGKEIRDRSSSVIELGLGYLHCSRRVNTLSGGETSRLVIGSGIKEGLTSMMYLIDEPARGLHPADYRNLTGIFKRLNSAGNSVVIVEHDHVLISQCDNIVELGPGSGDSGGSVMDKWDLSVKYDIQKTTDSYEEGFAAFGGCSANNLKEIDIRIPLNRITAVTGVSGSGKSSFIFDVIYNSVIRGTAVNCRDMETPFNGDVVDFRGGKVVRGSCPAMMVGIFDDIRSLYASSDDAKAAGVKKGAFSFNSKDGRCSSCNGRGFKESSLDFINEVREICTLCKGKRYREEVLELKYKDCSVADVLDMEVIQAAGFFSDSKKISKKLEVLVEAGLSYIKLGQDSATLSSGETGRLILAADILKGRSSSLYLMDEPFKGLHYKDCRELLSLFQRLCREGSTIVLSEHNPFVVASADYVVDLGPEGGNSGGELIYQGDIMGLLDCSDSETGKELKRRAGIK